MDISAQSDWSIKPDFKVITESEYYSADSTAKILEHALPTAN